MTLRLRMVPREDKQITLESAARFVEPGMSVAFGGLLYQNKPMAFVRQIVRERIGSLVVMPPAASSLDIDLLVGAGLVESVACPAVYFEDLGLAPCFRRAAEARDINVIEIDEAIMLGGLLATQLGAPFQAVTSMKGSQLPQDSPFAESVTTEDRHYWRVPPISPDVCVIHVQEADRQGNSRHLGATYADVLLAKASKVTIVQADRVVERLTIEDVPATTTLASHHVTAVYEADGGAWPTASHGLYAADVDHIRTYLESAKTDPNLAGYIRRHVDVPEHRATPSMKSEGET